MKINIYEWNKINTEMRRKILKRSELNIDSALAAVSEILENVRLNGDSALIKYARKFDGVDLSGVPLAVTSEEFRKAEKALSSEVKRAVEHAVRNVEKFHREQFPGRQTEHAQAASSRDTSSRYGRSRDTSSRYGRSRDARSRDARSRYTGVQMLEVEPGVFAGERYTPIESAGLYVPRGRGSFPSMMIMEAVPASVAEVKRIAVATPPDKNGAVDPATLYAASLCGVTTVYRLGGAQAIAALAYGTESVRKTAKIMGPGSKYIAAAKRLLYGTVDVGLPAGPSESLIIADETADPKRVALDLIIEAEHGSDSSAILVTHSRKLAETAKNHIEKLVENLKEPRSGFVRGVLSGYGGIIITESINTSIDFANEFAPEHLQIATGDPFKTLKEIKNAGEILLGQNTPFSLANYAAGANAILPTGRNAKTYSPLSVYDFMKFSSVVHITEEGLKNLSPDVITLADYEGFQTHALALRERMK